MLVLVYVANFVDRQVLSILNESIKRDLSLSDGEMGFLYGTAFAVFYALFGILAHWPPSLVPGVSAHAWTDIAAGLIFRA